MSCSAVRSFSPASSVHHHVPTWHSTVMRTETVTCNAMHSLGVVKPLAEESWFGEGRFFVFFKSVSSWAHKAKVTLFIYSPEIWQRYRKKISSKWKIQERGRKLWWRRWAGFCMWWLFHQEHTKPLNQIQCRQGQWISMGMFQESELLKVSYRWRTSSCQPSPHNTEEASIASFLWFWKKAFCFKVSIWLISFV